jgi:hypothetical protein
MLFDYFFFGFGKISDVGKRNLRFRLVGKGGDIANLIIGVVTDGEVAVMRIVFQPPDLLILSFTALEKGDFFEPFLRVRPRPPDADAQNISRRLRRASRRTLYSGEH